MLFLAPVLFASAFLAPHGTSLAMRGSRNSVKMGAQIKVGDLMPNIAVQLPSSERNVEAELKNVNELLGTSGTSILLGMPGAFTPSCTNVHLPGFIAKAEDFAEAGVQTIGVCTSNDRFVNSAWETASPEAEAALASGSVKVMSDPQGKLLEALGFFEYLGAEYGVRSKRFALVVKDGAISHVAVDEGTKEVAKTSAESILRVVTGQPSLAEEAAAAEKQQTTAVGALAVAAAAAYVFSTSGGGAGKVAVEPFSAASVAKPAAMVVKASQSAAPKAKVAAMKPAAPKPAAAPRAMLLSTKAAEDTKPAGTMPVSDKMKIRAEANKKAEALKMEAKKERAEAAKMATAAALRQANL